MTLSAIEEAIDIIITLLDHEGAEGFSEGLRDRAEAWVTAQEQPNIKALIEDVRPRLGRILPEQGTLTMPSVKIRRKSTDPILEAIQYTGSNLQEVLEFTGKHPSWDKWFKSFEDFESHVKSDGHMFKLIYNGFTYKCFPGDWIVRTPNGNVRWAEAFVASNYDLHLDQDDIRRMIDAAELYNETSADGYNCAADVLAARLGCTQIPVPDIDERPVCYPKPTKEGFYWATWVKTNVEDTQIDDWEVVEVYAHFGSNLGSLYVNVPGVEVSRDLNEFIWGPKVDLPAPLPKEPPASKI